MKSPGLPSRLFEIASDNDPNGPGQAYMAPEPTRAAMTECAASKANDPR